MNSVNNTLYIPLHAKALVTKRGLLLHDLMAVTIWNQEGFPLKGKSKWLAYFLAMRARVFDDWTRRQLEEFPEALVLHIGCGLDSRCLRVGGKHWMDIDLPEVIEKRRAYFPESEGYRLLAADAAHPGWVVDLPASQRAVVILEGVSMYLPPRRLTALLRTLAEQYPEVRLLMDVYTPLGVKASRLKNPVREMGPAKLYGIDEPQLLQALPFAQEHTMTPEHCVRELSGFERWFFQTMFGGQLARSFHRMLEYRK